MPTVHSIDVIVSDPEVRGGRPVIAGTGIRVQDIAAYHIFGRLEAEDLASGFNLPMSHVHAALSYYYAHKNELDEAMRADREQADDLYQKLRAQGKAIRLE